MDTILANQTLPWVEWRHDQDLGVHDELIANVTRQRELAWGAFSPRGLEVLRYAEANKVLRGKDFRLPYDGLAERAGIVPSDGWFYEHVTQNILGMVGSHHARVRGLLVDYFSARRVISWRPDIEDAIQMIARNVEGKTTFDLAKDICLRVSSAIFCRMNRIPDSMAPTLARWSDDMSHIFFADPSKRDLMLAAAEEVRAYSLELIAEREARPTDDLFSYLIEKRDAGLIEGEEVEHMFGLLLEASNDNVGNQFAATMVHLLSDPQLWERVVVEPACIPAATEEAIRLSPRGGMHNRVAVRATSLNDVEIPEGTWISVCAFSANRDPRGMPDPDRFMLDREETRTNLNFGGGTHRCLGSFLTNLEINVGIEILARMFPNMRLASPPVWTLSSRAALVDSIPVEIG